MVAALRIRSVDPNMHFLDKLTSQSGSHGVSQRRFALPRRQRIVAVVVFSEHHRVAEVYSSAVVCRGRRSPGGAGFQLRRRIPFSIDMKIVNIAAGARGGAGGDGGGSLGEGVEGGAPAHHAKAKASREDAVEEGEEPEKPWEADEGEAGDRVPRRGVILVHVDGKQDSAGGDADEERSGDYPYVTGPCLLLHHRHLSNRKTNNLRGKKWEVLGENSERD